LLDHNDPTSIAESDYHLWNVTHFNSYLKTRFLRNLPSGREREQLQELLLYIYAYDRCTENDHKCVILGYTKVSANIYI
jgi:hypothetical protein